MSYISGMVLDTIDSSAKFVLGTVGQTEDGKTYKYYQYEAATAAIAGVAGEVAYFATVAIGDATGTIVTSDLTDSDEAGAGVLQAALTDGAFGWLQVTGVATLTIALTNTADGSKLTPTGSADGSLDLSADLTDNICATSLDGSAGVIMCHFPH